MLNIASRAAGTAAPRSGARSNTPAADRPKAQLWLNVGMWAGEGDTAKFVSLPTGIPLDTQEPVSTRGQNADYVSFQQARNELLEALIAAGLQLNPGEDTLVNLQVQVRRVNDDNEVVASADNAYSIVNLLSAPAAA